MEKLYLPGMSGSESFLSTSADVMVGLLVAGVFQAFIIRKEILDGSMWIRLLYTLVIAIPAGNLILCLVLLNSSAPNNSIYRPGIIYDDVLAIALIWLLLIYPMWPSLYKRRTVWRWLAVRRRDPLNRQIQG
jgi:hypothetical protein